MTTQISGRLQVFVAFRYREYRLFWVGAAFSNLGIWALMAGRLWLMNELTHSPLMLGALTISGTGPILFLAMWGGVVADRVNRLRLMTFTRAMFSALALLTGALVALDVVQPWHLIAISLCTGILLSFDIPCRQAILPNLVAREHLLNAVVLYSVIFGASAVIGPAYFAPLVNLWGLEGLFFFVGASYALSVVMLMMMKPMPRKAEAAKTKLWQDLIDGLSYISGHRLVLSLIAIAVIASLFGASFGTLMPVFADQIFEGGVESYSLLLLGSGAGGLIGTAPLAVFGSMKWSSNLQLIAGVGFGLSLAAFAQITWLPASVGMLVVVSACSSAFGAVNNTLLQSILDDDYRGRVMSIHQLGWGASAVGGLLMGAIAQSVGAPFALTLCGIVTAAATGSFSALVSRGHTESAVTAVPPEAHSSD